MAPEIGQQASTVIETLFREPYRFDFSQAVRLLERMDRLRAEADAQNKRNPVGYDYAPETESVRFHASPALSFSAGPVSRLERTIRLLPETPAAEDGRGDQPPGMTVTFMGLTGPSGVLPDHYTTLLIRRVREKDASLRDFFDLFNHRIISLFYRAWEKYHFPTAYERSLVKGAAHDPISQCLFSLVGLGTEEQRGRSSIDDESFVFYSGFFSHATPSVGSLESVLADYFDVPVHVEQFQGQWLHLSKEDRSRLGSSCSLGQYNRLGVDVVLGERVWDVQSKFRIQLGPLDYQTFRRFIPTHDALQPLCQLTRAFVGTQFDFDVQPVLKASEVPMLRLAADDADAPLLGWNTWLQSRPRVADEPTTHPAESRPAWGGPAAGFFADDILDAVFSSDVHE